MRTEQTTDAGTRLHTLALTDEQLAMLRLCLQLADEMASVSGLAPTLGQEDTPENEERLTADLASLTAAAL